MSEIFIERFHYMKIAEEMWEAWVCSQDKTIKIEERKTS